MRRASGLQAALHAIDSDSLQNPKLSAEPPALNLLPSRSGSHAGLETTRIRFRLPIVLLGFVEAFLGFIVISVQLSSNGSVWNQMEHHLFNAYLRVGVIDGILIIASGSAEFIVGREHMTNRPRLYLFIFTTLLCSGTCILGVLLAAVNIELLLMTKTVDSDYHSNSTLKIPINGKLEDADKKSEITAFEFQLKIGLVFVFILSAIMLAVSVWLLGLNLIVDGIKGGNCKSSTEFLRGMSLRQFSADSVDMNSDVSSRILHSINSKRPNGSLSSNNNYAIVPTIPVSAPISRYRETRV